MSRLMLIRGLPGSGKSTLATVLSVVSNEAGVPAAHYEADKFFYDAEGKYNFDRERLGQAHRWCQDMTAKDLTDGKVVIVSNTFTLRSELEWYFDLAYEVLNQPPQVITMQNQYGSVHGVPAETLEKMRKRFQYDISELFINKKEDGDD